MREKQTLARLAFVRANALLGNGRWIDAVQGFLTALAAAISAGDVELTAIAGQHASWYTGWMGDFVNGERRARRAFENSKRADALTRARVMGQIAGHGAIARLDLSDFDRQMDAERGELLAMARERGNVGALLNIDVGHIVTECTRAGDWRALESRCRGTLERLEGGWVPSLQPCIRF